jgi:hypothetical protein
MFENQYRSYVMNDPFMRKLATAGLDMTSYYGVFHPSQTNYVAAIAGELCGLTSDIVPATPLKQETLVDLLEERGVSWKAYMEGYPGQPWNGAWQRPDYSPDAQPIAEAPPPPDLARYFRKHNPFASFHRIQSDEQRWSKIVDDHQFWSDVAADRLPEFAWFTPDIWNDGHYLYNTHVDTDPRTHLVPQVSSWLEYVFLGALDANKVRGAGHGTSNDKIGLGLDVDLLLVDPAAAWGKSRIPDGTVIVVTFDEADFDATGYDTSYDGPNQIYTVLLGPGIEPRSTDPIAYNHYSLIRTICRNFELGDLDKNDRDANPFRSLWNESFEWGPAQTIGATSVGHLALTVADGHPMLFAVTADGQVTSSTFGTTGWSIPEATGVSATGEMAAATLAGTVHLVVAQGSRVVHLRRVHGGSWSAPDPIGETAGSLAMCTYRDLTDDRLKLMLCLQGHDGFMSYCTLDGDRWSNPAEVGQLTDGAMSVAQFGASLYLVYKERRSSKMRVTSFNVAPFNRLAAVDFAGARAPVNDSSVHAWSPTDFVVGASARQFAALRNDYRTGGPITLAVGGGEMRLVHRGVYQDTPHADCETFGLTGVLTAASVDTNGYGTLRQAGWSRQRELSDVVLDPDSCIVSAGDGDRVHLVWQASPTRELRYCVGELRNRDQGDMARA